MKIAILGDTHLDIKHYSEVFHNQFETFYTDIFFPYLLDNRIEYVIQTGDLFDNKKQINFNSLDKIKEYFLNKFEEYNIKLITFPGNHDCPFWKTSLKNNAQSIILKDYKNIKSYDYPTTIIFDKLNIDIIPWICKDNQEEILNFISESESEICIGHFELQGFPVYSGYDMKTGMSATILNDYKKVISGHYHTKSERGNVIYVGVPYHLTRHDTNEVKGFHILDTETLELEFIKNPFQLFRKIDWIDNIINPKDFTNCYVKIIVKGKSDEEQFNKYVKELEEYAYDIDIVENIMIENEEESEEIEHQDTKEIISKYIKTIKNKEINHNKLEDIIMNLYNEAIINEVI